MLERDCYTLPNQANQKLVLGELEGAACSLECAAIVNRHPGLVLLIATDMKNVRRLHNEIQHLTPHPVLTLPGWETFPYDVLSPHQKIVSKRITALYWLPTLKRGIIIMSVNTLMQRVCPHSFLHRHTRLMTKNQHLSSDILRNELEQAGYHSVFQVMQHGEFSIRCALLDLYPMGSDNPYRVDFTNEKIHDIRIFDIDTQRTRQEVSSISLMPAHEFPTDKIAIERFRRQWREQFDVRRDAEHLYQQVSNGNLPAGIEYWQPLFFNEPLVSLFRYLPMTTLILNTGELEADAVHFWDDTWMRFKSRRLDPMRPLLPPESLWLEVDTLVRALKKYPRVQLSTKTLLENSNQHNMNCRTLPNLLIDAKNKAPMEKLCRFYKQLDSSVIFLVENQSRLEILSKLLARINILPKQIYRLEDSVERGAYFIIGASEHGFIDIRRNRVVICEGDLMKERGGYHCQDTHYTTKNGVLIRNLTDLHEGQVVVHLEHGIGRYAGMTTLEISGIKGEYLILIYADNDKLYIPVSSLHLITHYADATSKHAPLHKLGGGVWAKTRKKTAECVRDIAAELLDIYSQRADKSGFPFQYNQEHYQIFCEGFPFKLTTDQAQAINAVVQDMCQPIAMDRLVCGDIGFGKTEVAIRAAFLAIENQKQVAILVPTTLLAQQHFDNFCDRFNNLPVCIEMISRFRSTQDQARVLKQTAKGKVDILIGTHKLLQNDVKWHDLGLLIVDEEHRFGVRHKEFIRAMRANVDILTLTATPIPRTLHMAMCGMRDLSIIATPPARRLAVKTFVREYDAVVIREGILREILRGGQVYYLHNDVRNIEKVAYRLETLVPEARIAIAHGQMRERDLERVMRDFYHHHFNVLVCTTIIETGIDIANANTIIIERADHFGLAQLHQLRGRVGRSHQQAYCYLLTPALNILSQEAHKRLEVIKSLEDLGAGFTLATHDLEIRGAGELLGEVQSGQIETVGVSLYMALLEKALDALKAGREPSLADLRNQLSEVDLRISTIFPEEYIPDVNTRLLLYKRITNTRNDRDIQDLKVELIDRFGLLPESVYYLLAITSLRLRATNLGIQRIEGGNKGGFIEFSESHRIDPTYLIDLLQREPETYRLESQTRLRFICNLSNNKTRLNYVDKLLGGLEQNILTTV
ncbi:transcription-repair coupling factor [Candidatus Steffania adelgidicola]|uniref:transcription-repair coupling factor n=1 Tax=Candidatus Steffania adelgidicola TaxID=1076626 RepID=UPI001D02DDBE|nr:transcription-repair coupling factor [Candidatus Steffania adelgidicola]UDG79614.1 Transcription-repair-coupling factor [Candidatus Steffania adelgidicola]